VICLSVQIFWLSSEFFHRLKGSYCRQEHDHVESGKKSQRDKKLFGRNGVVNSKRVEIWAYSKIAHTINEVRQRIKVARCKHAKGKSKGIANSQSNACARHYSLKNSQAMLNRHGSPFSVN